MPTCSTPDCPRPYHANGFCQACYRRDRRANVPEVAERHRASLRRSYEKKIGRPVRVPLTPEERTANRRAAARRSAGMPDSDERREGPCEICGEHANPLCLDHDHATGEFRGWLCRLCNASLGGFKDSPALVRKALDYLTQNR